MPPRRSSRAASVKPVEPVAKPAPRAARSQPPKRAAAERSPSPPPKRRRAATKEPEPPVKKPRSKAAAAPAAKKPLSKKATAPARKPLAINGLPAVHEEATPKEVVPQKPYFNALPTPPEHTRPAPQLFVWGAGNFGQFGMGPDHLGEFGKPRKNPWIEEQIGDGSFGGEGAGLEAVAAGGLHTLFIDEKGTVSSIIHSRSTPSHDIPAGMVVWSK